MKGSGSRKKKPSRPNDAIAIAAFRNFAIDVERLLVRIYITHPEKYERMVKLMRTMLGELYAAGTSPALRKAAADASKRERKVLSDETCPPGYELCSDGLCSEVCDIFEADLKTP